MLANEQDSALALARKLQDAAALRVERRARVAVWVKGARLDPATTVAAAGLEALDRFDVRHEPASGGVE